MDWCDHRDLFMIMTLLPCFVRIPDFSGRLVVEGFSLSLAEIIW